MNKYHEYVNKLTDLANIPKQLTPEAIQHLGDKVKEYMLINDKDYFDEDCFSFLTLYVYNEAYNKAIEDALKELRKP